PARSRVPQGPGSLSQAGQEDGRTGDATSGGTDGVVSAIRVSQAAWGRPEPQGALQLSTELQCRGLDKTAPGISPAQHSAPRPSCRTPATLPTWFARPERKRETVLTSTR